MSDNRDFFYIMDAIIIKNGIIVSSDREYKSDIYIENGRIKIIGEKISFSGIKTVDAKGLYVLPGAVDAHVHLQLPTPAGNSCDDFQSGSIAAIAGGTTSVIDFVTPFSGQSLLQALKSRKQEAEKSYIDYSFHMSVTGWNDNTEKEIKACIKEGINSFKIYLAYKGVIGINDDVVVRLMDVISKNNALLTAHCENGDLIKFLQQSFLKNKKTSPLYHALSRPVEAEAEAVNRMISLAGVLNCPLYIVHVSSGAAMKIIQQARKSGQTVFAETCPHYLLLTEEEYKKPSREAISYILSPPLRTKKDQQNLWAALKNGRLDVVATDHCPFNNKGQKDIGINDFSKVPNGGNGLEERLSLLWHFGVRTGKISPSRFVELNCTNPAKIFGLYPQKGSIETGADADIILWNSDKIKVISAKTHHQNCDTNIYEGIKVSGAPEKVFVKGQLVWDDDKFIKPSVTGMFLKRKGKVSDNSFRQ